MLSSVALAILLWHAPAVGKSNNAIPLKDYKPPANPAYGSASPGECNEIPGEQLLWAQRLFNSEQDRTRSVSADSSKEPEFVPLILTPVINEFTLDAPGLFLLKRCGLMLVREEDLLRWRIKTDGHPKVLINGVSFLNISRYPGLVYNLDPVNQQIVIEGEPNIFFETVLDFEVSKFPTPNKVALGAYLNYGFVNQGRLSNFNPIISSFFTLGGFTPIGSLQSLWLAGFNTKTGDRSILRAQSTITHDWNQSGHSIAIGDISTPGSPLGGGVSAAGVSFGTNFGIQPGRIVTPVRDYDFALRRHVAPQIARGYLYPETNRSVGTTYTSFGTTVPYGPFAIRNLEVFGNSQYYTSFLGADRSVETTSFQTFNNSGLLKQGINQYNIGAGLIRGGLQQNLDGDTYKDLVFGARYRRGLTHWATIGVQSEFAKGRNFASLDANFAVPYLGVLDAAVAQGWRNGLNFDPSRRAYLFQVRNSWQYFNYAFGRTIFSKNFGALQSFDFDNQRGDTNFANIGFRLPWRDNVSIQFLDTERRTVDGFQRFLDVDYNVGRIPNVRLGFFGRRDLGPNGDTTFGVAVGTTFTVRRALSALGFGQSDPASNTQTQYVDTQRRSRFLTPENTRVSVSGNSDFKRAGFGLGVATNDSVGRHSYGLSYGQNGAFQDRVLINPYRLNAFYSYNPSYFQFGSQVGYSRGTASYGLALRGSVTLIGGKVRLTQPITNSLALVHLGKDMAGAKVNGFEADRDGDVLITNLQPYVLNPIRVGLEDVPLNVRAQDLTINVVPRRNASAEIFFELPYVLDASVNLFYIDSSGIKRPVPVGGYAKILSNDDAARGRGGNDLFPVADNGYLYLSGLGLKNTVEVRWAGKSCTIQLTVEKPKEADVIVDLGEMQCQQ